MSEDLEVKTQNALEFVEKLFFEVSYLIKEVEGLLKGEPEEFVICRSGGYAVTSRTSAGLEPYGVKMWLPKIFTVCFCEASKTELKGGITITKFTEGLKIIVLHVELEGRHVLSPRVLSGCIRDIEPMKPNKTDKFEKLLWLFSYYPEKIFSELPKFNYKDAYSSFKGEFVNVPLFNLNDSDAVFKKIVEPILTIYRT